MKLGVAYLQSQGAGERYLDQIEPAAHHEVIDLGLPEIGHSPGAIAFVTDNRGRLLVFGPHDFPAPDREAIQQAARQSTEAARLPFRVSSRQIEYRPAIEVIKVTADYRGFLHSDAIVAHERGNPA